MRAIKRSLVATCLSLIMILGISMVIPIPAQTMTVKAANKIMLNKKKATIYVGKSVQLKVKGTKAKVKWTSNNNSVAKVSSKGKVTGKKAGKAVITAKVGNKKYKCTVTVKTFYGSVSGNITYFYNYYRGNVPDVGSYVLLIPADGSAKKLKFISLYLGDEKNHVYQAEVDGTGRVNISHVACGKYFAFIVSKNTNSETYYEYLMDEISDTEFMEYYTDWLYPRYVSKPVAESIADSASIGGRKCYGKEIRVYKNEITYISHDFGMTYF